MTRVKLSFVVVCCFLLAASVSSSHGASVSASSQANVTEPEAPVAQLQEEHAQLLRRDQAYVAELKAPVAQLQEEHAQLLREQGHARELGAQVTQLQEKHAELLREQGVSVEALPGYHFRPLKNWINDPNGPMFYKGFYHLFYQYNPNSVFWGYNIVWAHAVSRNLIDWTLLEPAIVRSKEFDIKACWSGSATVLPGGTPVLMYTGIDNHSHQVQNVAYPADVSDPILRKWSKPDYNPIIVPDNGVNASAFRDPSTAWYGPDGHWRVVVGSKEDMKGFAVLYRSRDFKTWVKADHMLHSGMTGMWECPDFYPVSVNGGSRHYQHGVDNAELRDRAVAEEVRYVLKVSLDLRRYEYYTIGRYSYSTDRYIPDAEFPDNEFGLRYDYGNFYASKTFYDPVKHRRVLWGWANESDTFHDDRQKGWAGIQAVPRKVWLSRNGNQLIQWPVEEVEELRGKQIRIARKVLKTGDYFEVTGIKSVQSDVEVVFRIKNLGMAEQFDPAWKTDAQGLCARNGADNKGGVGPFGLWTLASSNLRERTAIFFTVFKADNGSSHVILMCADPTRSSYKQHIYRPTYASFVDINIAKAKQIALRTLIDHSVVESFGAHGRTCILSRSYPKYAVGHDAHLFVFNNGESEIQVTKLNAWEMRSFNLSTL